VGDVTTTPEYWDDFEPGMTLTTGARTITETDVLTWSGLVGDFNPAHVDVEHAKSTPFGQRIAHGNIAFNLSVGLTVQAAHATYRPRGFVRLAGWERVRFTAPVFIGDTIRAERTLTARERGQEGVGVIAYDVKVINQRDEVVMSGTERLLVRTREAGQERNQ
jgi:monoamine oxidase